MAVSSYFQKFEHHNEQNLMEDIVVESIRVYGNDVQYLPRKLNNIENTGLPFLTRYCRKRE